MNTQFGELKIKYHCFLPCFNLIEREKDIKIYRILESLILGKESSVNDMIKELLDNGVEKFVENLRQNNPNVKIINNGNIKITYSMIEDYAARNNLDKKTFQNLQMNLYLKNITKNDIVLNNDNEIISIR